MRLKSFRTILCFFFLFERFQLSDRFSCFGKVLLLYIKSVFECMKFQFFIINHNSVGKWYGETIFYTYLWKYPTGYSVGNTQFIYWTNAIHGSDFESKSNPFRLKRLLDVCSYFNFVTHRHTFSLISYNGKITIFFVCLWWSHSIFFCFFFFFFFIRLSLMYYIRMNIGSGVKVKRKKIRNYIITDTIYIFRPIKQTKKS